MEINKDQIEAKHTMARLIKNAITEFQDKTGLEVVNVDIKHASGKKEDRPRKVMEIEFWITLP